MTDFTTFTANTLAESAEVNDNFILTRMYNQGATDDSGSDHTTGSTSPALIKTFSLTGLDTTKILTRLDLHDIHIKTDNGASATSLYVEITDGADSYYLRAGSTDISGVAWIETATPFHITTSTSGLIIHFSIPIPYGLMTGSASWDVKIYMTTASGGNTATLIKGFTVEVSMVETDRDNTGSLAQS